MLFPIQDLIDEEKAYRWLLVHLHPKGLDCPNGHPLRAGQSPHTRDRAPVVEFLCKQCGRVFNIFTNTAYKGSRLPCSKVVLELRGFVQGTPTQPLAAELGLSRRRMLDRRKRFQALNAQRFFPLSPTPGSSPGSRRDVSERR